MTRIIVIGLFVLVGVVIAVFALMSRREAPRVPSLGEVSAFVMDYRVGKVPVGRIAVLGFWWWVGFHFFAR
jgi:hypothetical protein